MLFFLFFCLLAVALCFLLRRLLATGGRDGGCPCRARRARCRKQQQQQQQKKTRKKKSSPSPSRHGCARRARRLRFHSRFRRSLRFRFRRAPSTPYRAHLLLLLRRGMAVRRHGVHHEGAPGGHVAPDLISIEPTGLTTFPCGWLSAPVDISARPTGAIWIPWFVKGRERFFFEK